MDESKKEPEKEKGKKEEDLAEAPLKPPGEEDELDENAQVRSHSSIGICLIFNRQSYIVLRIRIVSHVNSATQAETTCRLRYLGLGHRHFQRPTIQSPSLKI